MKIIQQSEKMDLEDEIKMLENVSRIKRTEHQNQHQNQLFSPESVTSLGAIDKGGIASGSYG